MPIPRRRNNFQKEFAQTVLRLREELNTTNRTLDQLYSARAKPKDRKTVVDELNRMTGVCKTALSELESVMTPVVESYRQLAVDSDAKGALAAITRANKAPAKLGPSDEFNRAVNRFKQAKKSFSQMGTSPPQPASTKNGTTKNT